MAGTFVVSSASNCPWLKKGQVPTKVSPGSTVTSSDVKKPKTRSKGKREVRIKFPVFLEIAEVTVDPYWNSTFISVSKGKLPRHFFFNGNTLVYRRNTQTRNLVLPDSPHEASSSCISFLQEFGNYYSPADQQKLALYDCVREEKTWGRTPRRIRDMMICEYVRKIANSAKLSNPQRLQLYHVIYFASVTGFINKSNINLSSGCIISIDGLKYDGEKFVIDAPVPAALRKKESEIAPLILDIKKTPLPDVNKKWNKFLNSAYENIQDSYEEDTVLLNSITDLDSANDTIDSQDTH